MNKKILYFILFIFLFCINTKEVNAVINNANYCKYTVSAKLVELAPHITYSDGTSQSEAKRNIQLGPQGSFSGTFFTFDGNKETITGCPDICYPTTTASYFYFVLDNDLCNTRIGIDKYTVVSGSPVNGRKINVDDSENPDSSDAEQGDDGHSTDESIDVSCDGLFTPQALDLIQEILGYLRILAPIVLIVMVAQDFAIATILNDSNALKKASSKVLKRAIALMAFFFVPTMISVLLGLPGISNYLANLNIGEDIFCANAEGTEANPLPDNYWTIGYNPGSPSQGDCNFNFTEIIRGKYLDRPIVDALGSQGHSVGEINQCIKDKVIYNCPGTRSGAAAAAVALQQCMIELTGGYIMCYDHNGGKVYGGGYKNTTDLYGKLGINSNWGRTGMGATGSSISPQRLGLNCATSVRWALCNGGMNVCSGVSGEAWAKGLTHNSIFGGQYVIFDPYNRSNRGTYPGGNVQSGQVGDLLYSVNPGVDGTGHAMIIVGKDDDGYYIAENGHNTRKISFSDIENGLPLRGNGVKRYYSITIMEDYYNNPANKNTLY